jgi:GT2 family glycosyltransferase
MTSDDAAPLVTTVIPTFRRPALLRRAVHSALAQSMRRLRVDVYDNASGDGTAEVVAELARADPRVHYQSHATNIGAIANINHGFARVATPFFSLLSDDDVLLPGFYEKALEVLARHSEAVCVAGQVIEMTDDGRVVKVMPDLDGPEVSVAPPAGLFSMHLTMTGMLFRASVARDYAPFDTRIELMDLDFYLRLAARHAFVLVAQAWGIFVSHPGSSSQQLDVGQTWRAYRKVLDRFEADASVPAAVRTAAGDRMRRDLEGAVFRLGLRAIARGELESAEEARRILAEGERRAARTAFLGSLTALARRSSAARHIWAATYTSLRAAGQARASRRLQRLYSGYARHLKIPTPAAT